MPVFIADAIAAICHRRGNHFDDCPDANDEQFSSCRIPSDYARLRILVRPPSLVTPLFGSLFRPVARLPPVPILANGNLLFRIHSCIIIMWRAEKARLEVNQWVNEVNTAQPDFGQRAALQLR
mmetsp:Transcript_8630/g.24221  ORF Transcript_8630/g.24221 Transcript_8630/m.24221 type:complete len:123 (-) Transcript_8630:328-696(-)